MKWEKLNNNAIVSTGFVIVRCCSYGKPNGLYHVMLGRTDRKKNKFPRSLGYFDSAEKAKAFCDSHRLATKPLNPGTADARAAGSARAHQAGNRGDAVFELPAPQGQGLRAVQGD
jgi:hypothetical protein